MQHGGEDNCDAECPMLDPRTLQLQECWNVEHHAPNRECGGQSITEDHYVPTNPIRNTANM